MTSNWMPATPPPNLQHGKSAYKNWNCRCSVCTEAHREAQYQSRLKRAAKLKENPDLAVHGRYTTYTNWACRCVRCTEAHTEHYSLWRKNKES